MRFAGHCWHSKEELAGDVLLWTPMLGRRTRGRPKKTHIDQLMDDTGCLKNELPNVMNDRDGWRERIKKSRVSSTW